MRQSWTTMIILLFLGGTIISLGVQGLFFGADETTVFYTLVHVDALASIGNFFTAVRAFVGALWAALSWDYSFLKGDFQILQYAGWALSIGFIVSFIFAIRGTGSS